MKTTVELPDATFRRAKAYAASRGITLKRLFTEAVEFQLARNMTADVRDGPSTPPEPPWMAGFGELADLADETRAVMESIEVEFERLEPGDIP